jgi:anti-sigma factor RsiW
MESTGKCPDELDLAACVEERLPPTRRKLLEKHLAQCEQCRQECALVAPVRTEDRSDRDAPERLIRQVIDLYHTKNGVVDAIVRLVRDSLRVIYTASHVAISVPVPATVVRHTRAISPNMVILTKSFKDLDIACDIEKLSGETCNIRVVAYESQTGESLTDTRIELVYNERVLASSRSGRTGVLFEDIAPAKYTIRVLSRGEVCGALTLKIES